MSRAKAGASVALSAGDLLRSHDGKTLPVESVTDTNDDVTVYNMRIEEYHTYFVGDSHWGFSICVHNANYVGNLRAGSENAVQRVGPPLTTEEAIAAARGGEDVIAGSQGAAREIAGGATDPRTIPVGPEIHGPDELWHFHPIIDGGRGPHIWW